MESIILDKLISSSAEEIFEVWHYLFKKNYQITSSEGSVRLEVFKRNLEEIKQHNSDLTKTWQLSFNQFLIYPWKNSNHNI